MDIAHHVRHIRYIARRMSQSFEHSLATPCQPGMNRLQAVVTDCAFLGHAYRYTLQVGDLRLQASAAGQAPLEVGAEVAADFSFDHSCGLLADSTGAAIAKVGHD